jgi:hypothetical protein
MTGLSAAIDHLAAGRWQEAHVIVQEDDSRVGRWLHGIVHVLEGDLANAHYWYRLAGRPFPDPMAIEEELRAARAALS